MSMHNHFMKSGQALVVVLLILAVTAAVGLSVVSRSVTEVNLSSNQDASSQSLSAAESGIEAALQNSAAVTLGTPVTVGSDSQYTVTSRATIGGGGSYQPPDLFSGESATLFLSPVNDHGQFVSPAYAGNTFTVCWGKTGPGTPALEVNVYTRNAGTYSVSRTVYDSIGRVAGATVPASPTSPCPGSPYTYMSVVTIPAPAGSGLIANFRILFDTANSHPIRAFVNGVSNFPDQGQVIEVQGQTGQTSRRVSVTQTFPAPPAIFDNALFSGGNL